MSSSPENNDHVMQLLGPTPEPPNETTWNKLVEQQVKHCDPPTLDGLTCRIYSATVGTTVDQTKRCVCGRLARRHSFIGSAGTEYKESEIVKWVSDTCATEVPVTTYGQRKNGAQARFIRCGWQKPTTMKTLVDLITVDAHSTPKLLISCYGGAEGFTMTDSLEREFMSGIGHLAATEDVWVLTTGLNLGVSKLIGQGVDRHILLNESASKPKPIIIGMTNWAAIDEYTRESLKAEANCSSPSTSDKLISVEPTMKSLDVHPKYFLLFDDGRLDYIVNDTPRNKFVQAAYDKTNCHPVTIIVEGGINTLDVILNDLRSKRPVVIVDGSGRLSNVLGKLLENASDTTDIPQDEVRQQLELCRALWLQIKEREKQENTIDKIKEILKREHRQYLNVFQLGRDTSLTNTIFRAIFRAIVDVQVELEKSPRLLELAVKWNCVDGAHDMFQLIEDNQRPKHYPILFEQALRSNRPLFVDYFLRRYHNPLETTAFIKRGTSGGQSVNRPSIDESDMRAEDAQVFIVDELYKNILKIPPERLRTLKPLDTLDQIYSQLIGPYIHSFYRERSTFERFRRALSSFYKSEKLANQWSGRTTPSVEALISILVDIEIEKTRTVPASHRSAKLYGKQEMLRDLFLWSVYAGYADIAFVLLLQLKSRIVAALVAASIAERLSFCASNLHTKNKYNGHRIAYEEYATACIEACYKHNEQLACQLLLRAIPLFGNITCMQVAIASQIIPFVNTHCFNQVLDRQWAGQLDKVSKTSLWTTCKFTLSLASFGLLSPLLLDYHLPDYIDNPREKDGEELLTESNGSKPVDRKWNGIEYESSEKASYWHRFGQFHASPVVKMSYEFVLYIWYLLVFSYMILFHMRSPGDSIHWTEIYVTIAVSAAFIEEIRKITVEFHTQMLESCHRMSLWKSIIYATPYILFYIGIGLRFGSMTRPALFTFARIVLAIDLELWYIFSLRFVSAVKVLGPKLFMMRNMIRYLAAFMYIIFVCIAAYGVVSRALTMYSSLEFSVGNLSQALFYRPYWFLYSVVDDERNFLDGIIASDTSSSDQITEATVTHILLAFHMLLINILILNLLIAVFNFAINDVQDKNEYFWRYQLYELTREYFEKPRFTFPPLSLLVYIVFLIRLICQRHTPFRVFKRLATSKLDREWTDFENAATYEHARGFVEEKYRVRSKAHTSSSVNQAESGSILQTQVNTLNEKATKMQETINEVQAHTKQMMNSIDSMMKSLGCVGTSSASSAPSEPPRSSNAYSDSDELTTDD